MKKILLLIIVLAACAAVIYHQQGSDVEPSEPHNHFTDSSKEAAEAVSTLPISDAAEGARVYFITPLNGDVVTSPIKVEFGLENMAVSPAGIDEPFSGHHHILINMAELPDMSQPLPANESLIHFGGGQTETELDLPAGEHTLQLLLGNYLHIPHSEPVISEKITITVE